jgi:hypothetical protein
MIETTSLARGSDARLPTLGYGYGLRGAERVARSRTFL